MPTGRGGARFYVDESALGLGKILARARRDVVHPGHRLLPEIPPGTLDPDWMPIVASLDLVVISRDRHIKTKPAELRLYHEHGLRAFWIAGRKDMDNWGNLDRIVRAWGQIEALVELRGAGPWFYALTEGAIKEIPVRPPPGTSRMSPDPTQRQDVDSRPADRDGR